MKMDYRLILEKPIITEKSTQAGAKGKYVFRVSKKANKKEIAKAVEGLFNVHVQKVRTMMVRGKRKRRPRLGKEFRQSDWKKAIVQLAAGEKIDLFEPGE